MSRRSSRRSVFAPRPRRRRQSLPGMRVCRTCGQPYTPGAMVCPRCHGLGDSALARTAPLVVDAGPVVAIDVPDFNARTVTLTQYPEWLRQAARLIGENPRLEFLTGRADAPAAVVGLARAVLALRAGQPVPSDIDLTATESATRLWLGGEWITLESGVKNLSISPA